MQTCHSSVSPIKVVMSLWSVVVVRCLLLGDVCWCGVLVTEICLLTNDRRTATVQAETYCNLYSLSVEHFHAVLRHYPAVRRTMAAVADERLNQFTRDVHTSDLHRPDDDPTGRRPTYTSSTSPLSTHTASIADYQPDFSDIQRVNV